MSGLETAPMIAQRRWVSAQALFENRADLNGYPFQLLMVLDNGSPIEAVARVMAGAEILMAYGWELVTLTQYGQHTHNVMGIMRRVQAPR